MIRVFSTPLGSIFAGHGGRQGSAPKRPRCGSDAPKVTPDSPGVVNALNNDNERIRASFAHQMVMKGGHVVEAGLTDQVLDDPQHGYTQLLVSSVLQV